MPAHVVRRRNAAAYPDRRKGQALIESCVVLFLLLLLCFGLFQVAQLFAAREILDYSAARGARAQAVGFNHFMVHKTVRASSIPNAGRMITPSGLPPGSSSGFDWSAASGWERWNTALQSSPQSPQYQVERVRIPLYLGADYWGQLPAILEYDKWDSIQHSSAQNGGMIEFRVAQKFPLTFPLHRLFYSKDDVLLEGRWDMEDHAELYLIDAGW